MPKTKRGHHRTKASGRARPGLVVERNPKTVRFVPSDRSRLVMRRNLPRSEESMDEKGLEALIGKHHEHTVKRIMAGGTLSDAELRYYRRILTGRQRAEKLKQIKTADVMGPEEARWSTKKRRRRVFELTLKNYTVREMMDELEASSATIIEDLKAIRAELDASIDLTQATRILNEKMAEFQAIKTMAAMTMEEVEPGERAQLLSVIRATTDSEIELLQDAGVLSKAALKTEVLDNRGQLQQTAPLIEVSIIEPEHEEGDDKIVYLPGGSPKERAAAAKQKRRSA